jgi:hypothetical protein
MPNEISPALTPEQWEARDYRQSARVLDQWAKGRPAKAHEDDATEYVAKIGLNDTGSLILMNRAHDQVIVPPPARAALAALALWDQTFGFTWEHLAALRSTLDPSTSREKSATPVLRDLADRIAALLPAPGAS